MTSAEVGVVVSRYRYALLLLQSSSHPRHPLEDTKCLFPPQLILSGSLFPDLPGGTLLNDSKPCPCGHQCCRSHLRGLQVLPSPALEQENLAAAGKSQHVGAYICPSLHPGELLQVSRDPRARKASILYDPVVCVLAPSVSTQNKLESLEEREAPF